jgi:amino acid transporter
MTEPQTAGRRPELHRALGLRDLVLLNISCIVGLSSLSQVAQFGFGSIALYLLAAVTFLVPSALVVAELNSRMPEEGGFYLWTRTAFGDFHGYVAAWCYWLSNIVWLPTVLLLISRSCLYVGGDRWLSLAESPWYNGAVCLGFLWLTTLLNVLGMERAKWIQNVGATGTWVCVGLLLVVGSVFVGRFGSVHEFSVGRLVPDLGDLSLLSYFSIAAVAYGGLELAPVMAGEIRDPKRNIPRALLISAIAVVLLYVAGTLMLLFTVAEGSVGVIAGVAQAFRQVGVALDLPAIGVVGALLVLTSTMGLFGSWMTGTARIPFVVGIDRYLPEVVARVHPRWGSPWVSLLMQGGVLTVLFLASIAGSTVKEAFLVLLDMAVILYFIPFLYLFVAFLRHVRKDTGREGFFRRFRQTGAAAWTVAAAGFGITLLSTVLSAIPSKDVENGRLFVLKVVGGAAVLIGAGLVVYALRRRRARSALAGG